MATGLDALSRLEQGGTLTFSDADVTLVAGDGTGQDGFDRVLGELNAALPDVFSLRGVLPPPRNAADTGPARFFATLDPETGVALRGRVPEGTMGDTVHAYAAAAFGSERTDIATLAVPDLPGGWSIRAMAGLMALSHLHEGALTLEPETLRLSGRSGDPEIVGEVTRLLAEELGASADFQIDVVYDESLDPVASLPDPETCVARIQAVQEDRKIVFEPGSVEITEEAGEILDAIAELLPACTHVRMEIGGHTDSQGREEMNLNLSQSRADAVLNGLLARGVLVSNLTAQGYGESQPIASNETEEGRERNRRIEFRLLASAEAAAAEAAIDADAYPYETVPAPRPDSVVAAAEAAGDGDDDDDDEAEE